MLVCLLLFFVYPTGYVDTGGVISILYASKYSPVNKTMMTQLLLGTWTHILSTLTVVIPPLLWILLTSFLILVALLFLQYRSFLSLPPFMWIPLKSFLGLVDHPFLQYTSFPVMPFLVLGSNLKPIQSVRLV